MAPSTSYSIHLPVHTKPGLTKCIQTCFKHIYILACRKGVKIISSYLILCKWMILIYVSACFFEIWLAQFCVCIASHSKDYNVDCLAFVLLSHGEDDGIIHGTDKKVAIDRLLSPLTTDENMKHFAGKPKLVFVQVASFYGLKERSYH